MYVNAWKNGHHNQNANGYGIKVPKDDRDRYFQRQWKIIYVELEGVQGQVEINIDKDSFWNTTCHELISKEIGLWLIKHNLAPWPKGKPPHLLLEQIKSKHFLLYFSR